MPSVVSLNSMGTTFMSGHFATNTLRIFGSSESNAEARKPTTTCPASPRHARCASLAALSAEATAARACGAKASPATVRADPVRVRANSSTPSAASSTCICADNGGCWMPSAAAARVKLPCSATARKYLRCLSSIHASLVLAEARACPAKSLPDYRGKVSAGQQAEARNEVGVLALLLVFLGVNQDSSGLSRAGGYAALAFAVLGV